MRQQQQPPPPLHLVGRNTTQTSSSSIMTSSLDKRQQQQRQLKKRIPFRIRSSYRYNYLCWIVPIFFFIGYSSVLYWMLQQQQQQVDMVNHVSFPTRTRTSSLYSSSQKDRILVTDKNQSSSSSSILLSLQVSSSSSSSTNTSTTTTTTKEKEEKQQQQPPLHLIIIASVPRDKKHVISLWSQLECLGHNNNGNENNDTENHENENDNLLGPIQHEFIIVSQEWSRTQVIEPIVKEFMKRQHQFPKNRSKKPIIISTHYIPTPNKMTDRYDFGLWCSALTSTNFTSKLQQASYVTLINDSVQVIRKQPQQQGQGQSSQGQQGRGGTTYSRYNNNTTNTIHYNMETLTELQQHPYNTYDFVSLTYYQEYITNTTYKPIWMESILRTFTSQGISKFINHACNNQFLCQRVTGIQQYHRCIVDKYEIQIIQTMNTTFNRTKGLYPAIPPYYPSSSTSTLSTKSSTSSLLDTIPITIQYPAIPPLPPQKQQKQQQRSSSSTSPIRAWSAGNIQWWNHLVQTYNFPLEKVSSAKSPPTQCIQQLVGGDSSSSTLSSSLLSSSSFLSQLQITPPTPPCRLSRKECNKIHQHNWYMKRLTERVIGSGGLWTGRGTGIIMKTEKKETDTKEKVVEVEVEKETVESGVEKEKEQPTRIVDSSSYDDWTNIQLVISHSHCDESLDWVTTEFIHGYEDLIVEIIILSSCPDGGGGSGNSTSSSSSYTVLGAPKGSQIIIVPNRSNIGSGRLGNGERGGGYHYNYAWYLSQVTNITATLVPTMISNDTNDNDNSTSIHSNEEDEDIPDEAEEEEEEEEEIEEEEEEEEAPMNEAIIFLNDDRNDARTTHHHHHHPQSHLPGRYRTLTEMLQIASHTGFACGWERTFQVSTTKSTTSKRTSSSTYQNQRRRRSFSAYHSPSWLYEFSYWRDEASDLFNSNSNSVVDEWVEPSSLDMETTNNLDTHNHHFDHRAAEMEKEEFISSSSSPYRYNNFSDWIHSIIPHISSSLSFPSNLTQVCYGGIFVVTSANIIERQSPLVWQELEQQLSLLSSSSRTGNEDHSDGITTTTTKARIMREKEVQRYAELSWAGLLATPLGPKSITDLIKYSSGVVTQDGTLGKDTVENDDYY